MGQDAHALLQRFLDQGLNNQEARDLLAALEEDPAFLQQAADLYALDRMLAAGRRLEALEEDTLRSIKALDASTSKRRRLEDSVMARVRERSAAKRAPDKRSSSRRGSAGRARAGVTPRRGKHDRATKILGLPRLVWLAAAACVLAVVGVHMFRSEQPAPDPYLIVAQVQAGTESTIVERGGEELALRAGMQLHSRDKVSVPRGGQVRLMYARERGTVLDLQANTTAQFLDRNGAKHIELARGLLQAQVSPQAPGKTLRVLTPHAEAQVRGTAFSLQVSADLSRLEVSQGLVRLYRLPDRAFVDVGPKQYAQAGAGMELVCLDRTAKTPDPKTAPPTTSPVDVATDMNVHETWAQGMKQWRVSAHLPPGKDSWAPRIIDMDTKALASIDSATRKGMEIPVLEVDAKMAVVALMLLDAGTGKARLATPKAGTITIEYAMQVLALARGADHKPLPFAFDCPLFGKAKPGSVERQVKAFRTGVIRAKRWETIRFVVRTDSNPDGRYHYTTTTYVIRAGGKTVRLDELHCTTKLVRSHLVLAFQGAKLLIGPIRITQEVTSPSLRPRR